MTAATATLPKISPTPHSDTRRPVGYRVRVKTTPKSGIFLRDTSPFRWFVGGRGAGKTYAGAQAALIEAGDPRWSRVGGCTGIIIAPTYPMIVDIVVDVLKEILGPAIASESAGDMSFRLINGSRILMRSVSDHRQIDRLRGITASWCWAEEMAMLPDDYAWRVVMGTLREHHSFGRIWVTSTPRGKNWLYDRFVNTHNPMYSYIHASTHDNPFISHEYKQALVDDYGTGQWARQEIEGQFADMDGALFRREWFHAIDRAPEDLRTVVRAWDLAVTTKSSSDYTAGVKLGFDANGYIYILDVVRGKWEWPDARAVIVRTAQADGTAVPIFIEEVAFQAAARQELQRDAALRMHNIRGSRPDADKWRNALPLAVRAEAGLLRIVRAAWNREYIDEMCSFDGKGKLHDDQVDATSHAYRRGGMPAAGGILI